MRRTSLNYFQKLITLTKVHLKIVIKSYLFLATLVFIVTSWWWLCDIFLEVVQACLSITFYLNLSLLGFLFRLSTSMSRVIIILPHCLSWFPQILLLLFRVQCQKLIINIIVSWPWHKLFVVFPLLLLVLQIEAFLQITKLMNPVMFVLSLQNFLNVMFGLVIIIEEILNYLVSDLVGEYESQRSQFAILFDVVIQFLIFGFEFALF